MGAERRTGVRRRLARSSAWLGLGRLVTACAMLQAQEFQQTVDHLP
jgi:hypothetical protein